MTIHIITRNLDGMTAEVDTAEEIPSEAIFDLFNYEGNTTYWSDVASIGGAAEALVDGDLTLAEEYLFDLGLKLERPKRRVFTVTENMRRVTRYEVDEADLTPQLADLMERLDEAGDLAEERDRLVERLVAAAGGEDDGEVLDFYPADDAEYLLTHVNEEN